VPESETTSPAAQKPNQTATQAVEPGTLVVNSVLVNSVRLITKGKVPMSTHPSGFCVWLQLDCTVGAAAIESY
jgi:hypothetical protein